MKLFLLSPFVVISTIMIVTPSLAFAQDPFTFGNSGDPFAVGAGGGGTTSDSNITLQVRSDTDWSGSYGSRSGSTSADGHGNNDIKIACDTSYSANFQKKSIGHGTLTLNIIQNQSNPAYEHAINSYNATINGDNYTNYLSKVKQQYPMDVPQITNTQTSTAQFGTVSVSGDC